MIECRGCHRDLEDARVYACFPNLCADCVDRRLGADPDVAIDRELQARLAAGERTNRLELTPDQVAEVEAREQLKSIGFDPPITQGDVLFILETWGRYSLGSREYLLDAIKNQLEQRWAKPMPESLHG